MLMPLTMVRARRNMYGRASCGRICFRTNMLWWAWPVAQRFVRSWRNGLAGPLAQRLVRSWRKVSGPVAQRRVRTWPPQKAMRKMPAPETATCTKVLQTSTGRMPEANRRVRTQGTLPPNVPFDNKRQHPTTLGAQNQVQANKTGKHR